MPLIYIGHFAVTLSRQRQGLGRRLMGDALRRCIDIHDQIGAMGVGLDSLDAQSTRFYLTLGFVVIPPEPNTSVDTQIRPPVDT